MPKRDSRDLSRVLATKAAGDEATPQALWKDASVPDEVLGFHAQQAIEKRLKSALAHLGVAFERTHNIAYLLKLLADHDVPPPPEPGGLAELTPWATDFRYEDTSGRAIDRERARQMVTAVRGWAEKTRQIRE